MYVGLQYAEDAFQARSHAVTQFLSAICTRHSVSIKSGSQNKPAELFQFEVFFPENFDMRTLKQANKNSSYYVNAVIDDFLYIGVQFFTPRPLRS